MSKPNIFEISTKELSQDGFFTWLILWAEPENAQYDQNLHNTAQDFVRLLLDKPADFQIAKVNTDRQWKNIDIGAKINDDLFILIEDKTNTGQHSEQLSRYKETAQKHYKDKRQIVCIYLKTGSESKSSLKKVKEQGYRIIDRKNLLCFFANYQVINDIYADFTDRIKSIEKSEKSYETLLIGKWCWDSWTGFYQFLDEKLDRTDWRYVSNPNGGFFNLSSG